MNKVLSYILYYLGDWFCKAFVTATLGEYFEWPYCVYNWMMNKSLDLQGDGDGPWGPPDPEHDDVEPY